MPIHDQGYRRYGGGKTPQGSAWAVITRAGFERGGNACTAMVSCPVAQTNKEAHAGFIAFVHRFGERYGATGFVVADAQTLTDTIDRWLSDHICRIDIQLKGCED